jgi:hypothetical protein
MSSEKVEKSSLIGRSSAEKASKGRYRDVVVLGLSFLFTIVVAAWILFFIERNQCKSANEIEKIVESILDAKGFKKAKSESKSYERKRGYLDEVQEDDLPRQKRAVHDSRSSLNGEFENEAKRSTTHEFLSKAEPPIVEFFHPELKKELEKNDTEIMKRTGLKGAAPKGDSWVWLTSYSRIPFEAIEGFCKKTKEYCPPGPTGL